jgi:hypothetical protein
VAYQLPLIAENVTSCLQKNIGTRRPEPAASGKTLGSHSVQSARSCGLPTERRRSNSRGSLRVVSRLAEDANSILHLTDACQLGARCGEIFPHFAVKVDHGAGPSTANGHRSCR